MSVEELLKLRDDVGKVLSQKAVELEEQLSMLGGEVGSGRRGRRSTMKGRKVAVKYRDKEGNTWAGRGAQPVWLREKLKAGAKLEDFAVQRTAATRKASAKKTKKRRRKKWRYTLVASSIGSTIEGSSFPACSTRVEIGHIRSGPDRAAWDSRGSDSIAPEKRASVRRRHDCIGVVGWQLRLIASQVARLRMTASRRSIEPHAHQVADERSVG
jgi:hypothetical protein